MDEITGSNITGSNNAVLPEDGTAGLQLKPQRIVPGDDRRSRAVRNALTG